MKNLPAYKALLSASTASFAIVLTTFFAWANPAHLAAQGCPLTCNDLTVVEVPASGSIELLPSMISDGDLTQVCPNGILNTQSQINTVWQPATGNMVFNTSHIGQIILSRIKDQVTGNSCWGNVQVVAAPPPPLDTIHFQLCAELWKGARPINGAKLTFQPNNPAFPYSPIVIQLDNSHSCAELEVVTSQYLPGTTFSYSASMPDSGYLNGVDIIDMCQISRHILGISPLPSPYAIIAADANKSNSVTTFDLVESHKLILGIYKQLPNNTAWRMVPDYCHFSNPNNPLGGVCESEISLSELLALNNDTAKIIGLKIADVNGDVKLSGVPNLLPVVTDSLTVLLPGGPVLAGQSIAVPVKLDKDFSFGSTQLHLYLDPAIAHFDSLSSGAVTIQGQGQANAFHNQTTGSLRISILGAWLSPGGLVVPAGETQYFIHINVTQNAQLEDILKVITTDPNAKTFAIGPNCESYFQLGSAYSGSVPTYSPELRGLRVQPPSPNPFSAQTFLTLELESAETAILEVTDLMGRLVFSEQKELPTGTYRWEIPASAVARGGFGIWRLRVGGQMVSGKLTRQ